MPCANPDADPRRTSALRYTCAGRLSGRQVCDDGIRPLCCFQQLCQQCQGSGTRVAGLLCPRRCKPHRLTRCCCAAPALEHQQGVLLLGHGATLARAPHQLRVQPAHVRPAHAAKSGTAPHSSRAHHVLANPYVHQTYACPASFNHSHMWSGQHIGNMSAQQASGLFGMSTHATAKSKLAAAMQGNLGHLMSSWSK